MIESSPRGEPSSKETLKSDDSPLPRSGDSVHLRKVVNDLTHYDEYRRMEAASRLGHSGSEVAVSILSGALREERHPDVRRYIVTALYNLHSVASVEALVEALKDEDPRVRENTTYALGRIASTDAVPGLLGALHDPAPRVKEGAATALGQIKSPDSVEALRELLHDKETFVRKAALIALTQLGEEL